MALVAECHNTLPSTSVSSRDTPILFKYLENQLLYDYDVISVITYGTFKYYQFCFTIQWDHYKFVISNSINYTQNIIFLITHYLYR